MSKELEAFKEILDTLSKALKSLNGSEVNMNSRRVKLVEQGLQRLEAIENAEPNEAIKCLESFLNCRKIYEFNNQYVLDCLTALNTIKQALSSKSNKENAFDKIETIIHNWSTTGLIKDKAALEVIDNIIKVALKYE